ncbi:unnamed protein product [Oppiella nova]|uniref:Ig-like domain-containing protein n=1 Tax=Oppiella nova TaxID=334625 RepID=A0A7R9LK95_9ACAR|nr:unnamed protein product [Oppiella nova]CAG2164486.1 unnamed protein product [Oppiella nova]
MVFFIFLVLHTCIPFPNRHPEPPIFTLKPLEYYQKPIGSEVVMACDGVGNPKPVITWRKICFDYHKKIDFALKGMNEGWDEVHGRGHTSYC